MTAKPPGVAEWLRDNPGAHAGEVAGWWYCRYPIGDGRTLSASRCTPSYVLTVLEDLREDARLAVQRETGWRVTSGPDGTWRATRGAVLVAAVGMARLRELIGGDAPTEAERGLAGLTGAVPS